MTPAAEVDELMRVLRPAGQLALTTPNKVWEWLVKAASFLHARPFRGIENFLGWEELEQYFRDGRSKLLRHRGFHPWPFQFSLLRRLSRAIDGIVRDNPWGKVMVNQAILIRKL